MGKKVTVMIVYDYISDDFKTIFYTNISNCMIPVVVKVYESFTDTLIFSNELNLDPNTQYYTYMPQAWKNRKVLICNRGTDKVLLPLWVDGYVSLPAIDNFGYIKKLFEIETDPDLQLSIHATLSEHFMDRKYTNYVDVEEGDVVIDIGFNYGVFALRSLYKNASKIYGFEPNIRVYEVCQKVYTDKSKIELYNFAVGNKNEKVLINQGKSSLTSSTYGVVEDFEISYEIESINLTDFLFFHQINKVDFLKVDCEGSEYDIFESIPDDIFSNIKKVHVEYHYNDGIKVMKIIDKLNRNDFEWRFDSDSNERSIIGMIYAKKIGL